MISLIFNIRFIINKNIYYIKPDTQKPFIIISDEKISEIENIINSKTRNLH